MRRIGKRPFMGMAAAGWGPDCRPRVQERGEASTGDCSSAPSRPPRLSAGFHFPRRLTGEGGSLPAGSTRAAEHLGTCSPGWRGSPQVAAAWAGRRRLCLQPWNSWNVRFLCSVTRSFSLPPRENILCRLKLGHSDNKLNRRK